MNSTIERLLAAIIQNIEAGQFPNVCVQFTTGQFFLYAILGGAILGIAFILLLKYGFRYVKD